MLRSALILCLVLAAPVTASALDWLDDSNRAVAEAIKQGSEDRWFEPAPPTEEQAAAASAIAQRGLDVLRQSQQAAVSKYPVTKPAEAEATYVFVSFAIPAAELRRIAEEAHERGAVLVFRGVPKGGKLTDIGSRMRQLLGNVERAPTVVLDPTLFTNFRVRDVPVMAMPLPGTGKYVTASGIVNVDWLRRKIAAPESLASLNLGKYGLTWEVSEPDFVEEMKRRMLALDWAGMKQKAIDRFWRQQRTFDLPQAKRDSRRMIDPTLVITKNIRNGDGVTVLAAGTAINPLKQMPLTKRYIVFDGRYTRQVELANRLKQEAWAQGRGASLIMANFESGMGWEGFESLQGLFKAPVFLLNDQILNRFHLKNLPAMVEAEGFNLVVTEFAVAKK